MKTMTLAGALLAVALVGCTMTGPGSSSRSSHSYAQMQSEPAVYHNADFGEPNNMPFDGGYTAAW